MYLFVCLFVLLMRNVTVNYINHTTSYIRRSKDFIAVGEDLIYCGMPSLLIGRFLQTFSRVGLQSLLNRTHCCVVMVLLFSSTWWFSVDEGPFSIWLGLISIFSLKLVRSSVDIGSSFYTVLETTGNRCCSLGIESCINSLFNRNIKQRMHILTIQIACFFCVQQN